MRTHEVREEQKWFLKNNRDPRPIKFFMKFNYHSKSTEEWEAGEYKDDWANYEDEKNNRKADLDEKLDSKKLSDATVVSSLPSTSSVSSSHQINENNLQKSYEIMKRKMRMELLHLLQKKLGRGQENPTSNVYSELAHQVIPRTDSSESSNVINDEERMVKNDEELELYAKESSRDDEEKWIVCDTDLCNTLTKWKLDRVLNNLGFYDIVDITPGSNSDFVRSLPIDVVREIRQSKYCQQLKMDDTDGMKKYIAKDFRKLVDESYIGEKCLLASSEDRNLEKNDGEDRSAGRKIDIIWSMKPTDLEFSICECTKCQYLPGGLYVFCEILRSKLPTNEFEVGLLLRSVPALLKFRKLLEESLTDLKDYIQDACTRTPDDNGNADLFITHTDLTPPTNRKQSN
ncbi:4672_t:CDS:10 [Ambispora leptoticha]|uniref:4672_t:CDS:1 n=1 Tax=Ambispora leptoticha TaxID=144679 RepID=A0A9N9E1R4_9GLOM|nr:4672_t:CDS:10 [Ambispora leptoticha]